MLTDIIKQHLYHVATEENADVLLVENRWYRRRSGKSVFLEAARQLSHEVGQENCLFVHLTYIPIPPGVNEQKSKPTQNVCA
jgi:CTP synthase